MDKKLLIAALVLIGISSLLLVSLSITGMVALSEDPYTKPLCSSNEECPAETVCCAFYGSESGVCHSPEICPEILGLTMVANTKEVNELIHGNTKEDYISGLLLGIAIIGFVIYFSERALADKANV